MRSGLRDLREVGIGNREVTLRLIAIVRLPLPRPTYHDSRFPIPASHSPSDITR